MSLTGDINPHFPGYRVNADRKGRNETLASLTVSGLVSLTNTGSGISQIGKGTFTGALQLGGNTVDVTANPTGGVTIGNGLNSVYLGSQGGANSIVNIQVGSGNNQTNICTNSYAGTLTIGNVLNTTNIATALYFTTNPSPVINSGTVVYNKASFGLTLVSPQIVLQSNQSGTAQTALSIAGKKLLSANNTLDDASGNIITTGNFTSVINNTGGYTSFITQASRSSLAPVRSGDTLCAINVQGYDNASTYATATLILSSVDGSPSTSGVPGRIDFSTTDTTGATNTNLSIRANRSVTTMSNTLDDGVTGAATFAGLVTANARVTTTGITTTSDRSTFYYPATTITSGAYFLVGLSTDIPTGNAYGVCIAAPASAGNWPFAVAVGGGSTANLAFRVSTSSSVLTLNNTVDDGSGNSSWSNKMTLSSTATASQTTAGALVFSGGALSIGRAGASSLGSELNFGTLHTQRMVCLYDGGTIGNQDQYQYYGFGVNSGMLYYSVAATTSTHGFFAGVNSSSSNMLCAISSTANYNVTGVVSASNITGTSSLSVSNSGGINFIDSVSHSTCFNVTSSSNGGLVFHDLIAGVKPMTFGTNGGTFILGSNFFGAAAASYTTTSTMSANDIANSVIYVPSGTGAITLSFDTGTNLANTFFPSGVSPYNNQAKIFLIVNQSSNTVTVAGNTGVTLRVSKTTIAGNTSALFVILNTGTNAFLVLGGN